MYHDYSHAPMHCLHKTTRDQLQCDHAKPSNYAAACMCDSVVYRLVCLILGMPANLMWYVFQCQP